MKRLTREWVRKAEADFRAALRLGESPSKLDDQACFFCQQSAEKYLKAILQERGVAFARTHDLEALCVLLAPAPPGLQSHRRGLKFLSRFAVQTRYPGDAATRRQAVAALKWAGRVREASRAELGLAADPPVAD